MSFVTDGTTQFHLAEKDLGVNFRTGQSINPVERGHIAFRTDDIAAFKARLKEKGIPYSDFGTWAMKGWEQIFFYDPDGNIVEVHQVQDVRRRSRPRSMRPTPGPDRARAGRSRI